MRGNGRIAALATLGAAIAVVGLLVLSHGAAGTIAEPQAPLVLRASFDPPTAGFGDRITATVAIEIDRRRVRAQSLRLRYRLAPLRPLGPRRTVRTTRDGVELETITVPVACISDACVAAGGVAQLHLAPATATVATPGGGVRHVSARWPSLAVRDRVRSADVNATQPPLQADATPLAPTYSASPGTLASILDVAAGLLGAAAVALAAWEIARFVRRRRGTPELPLVRALRLARAAQALPGPERRRALERLARVLRRGDLQQEATRLAWSEPTPEPAELGVFVEAIERKDDE
jgi:hypothetical protein